MDNLVWAEQQIRDLTKRVKRLERTLEFATRVEDDDSVERILEEFKIKKQRHPLYEYFEKNWKREPYPVIDHALRIDVNSDGDFHFYIHPQHTDGDTLDFVVSETEVKLA